MKTGNKLAEGAGFRRESESGSSNSGGWRATRHGVCTITPPVACIAAVAPYAKFCCAWNCKLLHLAQRGNFQSGLGVFRQFVYGHAAMPTLRTMWRASARLLQVVTSFRAAFVAFVTCNFSPCISLAVMFPRDCVVRRERNSNATTQAAPV